MSATQRLARILATRTGKEIELAIATQAGQTIRLLASEDQIDRLVDELEDILHAPAEPDPDAAPDAA